MLLENRRTRQPVPFFVQGIIGRFNLSLVFLCLVLLLCNPHSATAQNDTSRKISPSEWRQLTADKELNYKNDLEKDPKPPEKYDPGALQRFFMNIMRFFGSLAGNTLTWILIAVVVIYIIYRLFFSSDSFLFGKGARKIKGEGPPPAETEDIADTNWEALLQKSVAGNDLRLAVRYSYMWLLQLLQQKELIRYRIDKTNFDYYNELQEANYKKAFRQLSRQYEYTWYGHFAISGEKYNEYIDLFNYLRKQLNA